MKRLYFIVSFLLCLFGTMAHAGPSASGSADPALVNVYGVTNNAPGNFRPLCFYTGRALTSNAAGQAIDTTKRNLLLIYIGQSTDSNVTPTAYSPTNPGAIDNMSVCDGALYAAVDPLIGPSIGISGNVGGNPCTVLIDSLITTNRFDRAICEPVAIDGSIGVEWATGINATRGPAAAYRYLQLKTTAGVPITCSTTGVTCAVLCCYGESDNVDGTSQASYVASFNTLWTNVTNAGFSPARWFVMKKTLFGTTSAAIQAAQTQNSPSGVINNAIGIYLGGNIDAITGNTCPPGGSSACRQDGVHPTNAGAISFETDPSLGNQQAMHSSGAPF